MNFDTFCNDRILDFNITDLANKVLNVNIYAVNVLSSLVMATEFYFTMNASVTSDQCDANLLRIRKSYILRFVMLRWKLGLRLGSLPRSGRGGWT